MRITALRTTVIAGAVLVAGIFAGTVASSASVAAATTAAPAVAATAAPCTEMTRLDSDQFGTTFTQGIHLGDPARGTTALYYGFENLTQFKCGQQLRYQAYIGKQNGTGAVRIDQILVTDANGKVLTRTLAPLSSGNANFVRSDTPWKGGLLCETPIRMTVTFSVRWADGTLTSATRTTSSDHCWNR